jgi:hypothetical protein
MSEEEMKMAARIVVNRFLVWRQENKSDSGLFDEELYNSLLWSQAYMLLGGSHPYNELDEIARLSKDMLLVLEEKTKTALKV